jgi:hypothetical protein
MLYLSVRIFGYSFFDIIKVFGILGPDFGIIYTGCSSYNGENLTICIVYNGFIGTEFDLDSQ